MAAAQPDASLFTIQLPAETQIVDMALSPDGNTIVTIGSDNITRFWDTADGEQLFQSEPNQVEYDLGFNNIYFFLGFNIVSLVFCHVIRSHSGFIKLNLRPD